jgi:hypothetical protein
VTYNVTVLICKIDIRQKKVIYKGMIVRLKDIKAMSCFSKYVITTSIKQTKLKIESKPVFYFPVVKQAIRLNYKLLLIQ